MGPIGEKIADEFIHPKPPGHFLVMLQTAQAFGLTEEEVFTTPMLSEFRGKIDFMRGIVYEGTAAEWYAAVTTEEQIGHWSAACYKALTSHYGFDREKATYFATHVEADLSEHEEGVMGHASFNRMALQRLLETGMADERPTYGLEYCAMTSVDLHGVMLRAAMEEATREN
jgi:pyrroloquinoline quinone (PQQ) biosynthesis protein C